MTEIKPQQDFDIVINGGGMVGAALACGLVREGFSVAVIDRQIPPPFDAEALPSLRVSALGHSTVGFLQTIGIWSQIKQWRCAAYRKLKTWESPSASAEFTAEQLGLPELGYMVENDILQRALWEQLQQLGVQIYCPQRLQQMQRQPDGWLLSLDNQHSLRCRMVVGADGANSQVRQLASIGVSGWDYAQHCMLISVRCENAPGDMTWQQFTPQGPRAFLPLYGPYASLVWYDSPARITYLKTLSKVQLAQAIAIHFPAQTGAVEVLERGSFALRRQHVSHYVQPGLALVGDAAHTINPLAGQGVNLGYRDIETLITVLAERKQIGQPWWQLDCLKAYQRQRWLDNHLMQAGMDLFYFSFSNDHLPLKIVRNLALMAAERSGVLKQKALSYALGIESSLTGAMGERG